MFEQADAAICFGWGLDGLMELGPAVETVVIVDVLRYTSAVSVACARGAVVLPYEWDAASAEAYAVAQQAEIAGHREDASTRWSLSPTDLLNIPKHTRLVLPSPNGSALSFRAAQLDCMVIAGSLRNAAAVGRWLAERVAKGGRVAVIAAGERRQQSTQPVAALRIAVEDLYGAGAVIARTIDCSNISRGVISPEALAAVAAFRDAEPDIESLLLRSGSGRELVETFGWRDDVHTAAAVDVDKCVPTLHDRAFTSEPEFES